jgi:hypothetical protein
MPRRDHSGQRRDGEEPLTIALAVTRAGGRPTFDFAGSPQPRLGPMNPPRAMTPLLVCLARARHLPRRASGRVRAAGAGRDRRHLPRRAASAPRFGLCRPGEPADRRGGVPCACRAAFRACPGAAGGHPGELCTARPRPRDGVRPGDGTAVGWWVWRERQRRRAVGPRHEGSGTPAGRHIGAGARIRLARRCRATGTPPGAGSCGSRRRCAPSRPGRCRRRHAASSPP